MIEIIENQRRLPAEIQCPCCGRLVKLNHFSCHAGKQAGRAMGKSKRRGNKSYYAKIAKKAAASRKRNNLERRQAGLPVL